MNEKFDDRLSIEFLKCAGVASECSPTLLPVQKLLGLGDDSALLPIDEDDSFSKWTSGSLGRQVEHRIMMLNTEMPLTAQTLTCVHVRCQCSDRCACLKEIGELDASDQYCIHPSVPLSLLPFIRNELGACSSLGTADGKIH